MSRVWMPLYVADYLADTGHLTTLEHGAYMLLIMHYWKTGGLPNEDERLARIARLSLEQWSSIASTIKAFFDDGWHHDRIDAELAKADEKYEKRANAGKKGGQARAMRKQNPSNASAMINHSHSHSHSHKETTENAREVSKLEEGDLFAAACGSLGSSPNLFVMAEPMRWKAAGMDWLLDIIPAIRTAAAKGRPSSVQSWNYFSQAIADWHAKRTAPMPKGSARDPPKHESLATKVLNRMQNPDDDNRSNHQTIELTAARAG